MQISGANPTVVSLVIERDGAILLGRRSSTKDHAPGQWEAISGRVEASETLSDAARREAFEETGLVVEVVGQLDSFKFRRGADAEETFGATFHCRVHDGRERLSEEHDQFAWATLEQARTYGLPEGLIRCIEIVLRGGRMTPNNGGRPVRNTIIAALATLGFLCGAVARAPEIDLDKPGAMETLQRNRPDHYNKVVEAISKAQVIHVEPAPTTQHAGIGTDDPRTKGLSDILLSNPAKKRLVIPIDDAVYRVTAHLTKDPGKLEKAK